MYHVTLDKFSILARQKTDLLQKRPSAFALGALMGGAYIGIGIILILSLGESVDPSWQKFVMAISFGVALTLVIFAGAELFTGHTMYMTVGCLAGVTNVRELLWVWLASWFFNLIGSVFLVCLFNLGGGGAVLQEGAELLKKIALYKIHSSSIELIARGALCNWLVCLAIWMCARTTSDGAKAVFIFWCLFTFIACGFEHSVANMTLLTLALIADGTGVITLLEIGNNLVWVTLGNIIGGAVFMGLSYWLISGEKNQAE